MHKWILVLIGISALTGCEKTLLIQPDQQAPKLVVEAQIENGQPPVVSLSSSLNYFAEIDPVALSNAYVRGAKISISDGTKMVQLKEMSAQNGNHTFYYYTTNQTTPVTNITGEFGKKYTMTVESGGQLYTSSTTIPLPAKKVDSLWWKKAPGNTDSINVILMGRITDPPGLGNYIRYFTRANNENFFPGFRSVYDDQIIDGKTYEVQINRGVSKNDPPKRGESGYFKRGDTVTLKHCNIDKASFDFWRTWEFTYESVGNPFSSPGKVIGNISNGGLGSFCGYAIQYKTLIIPK
jgi:hypothetical protein